MMHISYRCAENKINTNRDALVFLLLSTYTTFDLFSHLFFFFLPRLFRSFLRIIERCEAERKGGSLSATTQIEFYFVSIPFLIIRVSECLSLIVDDHVYTGGETRVNSSLFFFFLFRISPSIRKFRRSENHHQHCGTRRRGRATVPRSHD